MRSALQGKYIVNTRAVHQAFELDTLLIERGAVPLSYPCIAVVPPENTDTLDKALSDLANGCYDWLVLTSANTVFSLSKRLMRLGVNLERDRFKIGVVGSSTARVVYDQMGLKADVVPDTFIAESLAEALEVGQGTRVLLPESAIARPALADALRATGADVTVVTAYETVPGTGGVELTKLIEKNEIDAITFTSSSTVTNCVQRIELEGGNPHKLLKDICLVCIGPRTEQTASELGLHIPVVADPHTLDGMVDKLEEYMRL